jgi:flagellar protein FlaG
MSSKVASSTRVSATAYGTAARIADDIAPTRRMTEAESAQGADLRLVIEEAGEPGQFIYTIIDRRTGRVVSRRARDEVLRMREDDGYAAGTLFDSKA